MNKSTIERSIDEKCAYCVSEKVFIWGGEGGLSRDLPTPHYSQ